MSLNQKQEEAANTLNGPLLILAGAGSGKTTVLTHRIGNLIQFGVSPEQMLAVTFTNKAADEMKERVATFTSAELASKIWIGTFHATCSRILKAECKDKSIIILDANEAKSLLKKTILDLGFDVKKTTPHGTGYYLSMLKNEMIDVKTFCDEKPSHKYVDWERTKSIIDHKIPIDKKEKLKKIYKKYQELLEEAGAVDFDDLILNTIHLLIRHPQRLAYYQEKFTHLMVDEYQDTNHAQYKFIQLLAKRHRNLAVVGDDSQSIYAFRGSDIRNILEFERDYPEAKCILLEENYRCTPTILQAANEIISHNASQRQKNLFTAKQQGERIRFYSAADDRDESRYVTNEIKKRIKQGETYSDIALLFRVNSQSKAFEESFLRAAIPYTVIGAVDFYERPEYIAFTCLLRSILQPNENHWFIKATNLSKAEVDHYLQDREDGLLLMAVLEKEARKEVKHFAKIARYYHKHLPSLSVSQLVAKLIMDSGFVNLLLVEKEEDRMQEKVETIGKMMSIALDFKGESLVSFLNHLEKMQELDVKDDGNSVKMMTLHAAKGLEFPTVFLVGMEEGVFPHKKSEDSGELEEERRLCYVGVTRAKEHLYLINAKIRRLWGREEEQETSRFLYEFSKELLDEVTPLAPLN